jgi:hypothetical protein
MKKLLFVFLIFILDIGLGSAQTPIVKNVELHTQVPGQTQLKLFNALDTLMLHISKGTPQSSEINQVGSALSLSVFKDLKGIENNAEGQHYYNPTLLNLYQVTGTQYFISLAFISNVSAGNPVRAIIDFVAVVDSNGVKFSIPVYYLTRSWKIVKIGNITYHYPDNINISRAKGFDKANTRIALKLGLKPEQFDFYLCNNYQEILHLLGYGYDGESAGSISDGYGVDTHTIFSIMHNEDFSHDTFHYYTAKIRKNARNSAAEEGIAYSWGNAYYTDEHGEMISQKQLVPKLKEYLLQHPQASLLELFSKNPMILTGQLKVRSLIASLICDEVERKQGIAGIKDLINCGRGDDNYFTVVNKFTGINTSNFNERVGALLENYK